MQSDIEQIKFLLWAVLALQVFFIAANVACRIFGCGRDDTPDYKDLISKGKVDQVLDLTRKRLETHPDDTDALYYRAKALQQAGLLDSARECVRRLGQLDPMFAQLSKEWIGSIDQVAAGDS